MMGTRSVFFLGIVLAALVGQAHASIVSRSRIVTAQYSHIVSLSGVVTETVVDEQIQTFDGIGQQTVTVQAPIGTFFNVAYTGPAFAEATAKVFDFGGTDFYVATNAFATGQTVSTPAYAGRSVLRSVVEDVASGVAPVGDGIRVLYSFDLKNLSAQIWDNRFTVDPAEDPALPTADTTLHAAVQLSYVVEFNGVTRYQSFAQVRGNKLGVVVLSGGQDGVDFNGDVVAGALDILSETTGTDGVPRVIDFEGKSVRFLDLGIAPGGASYEVKATMTAGLFLPEYVFDIGGQANIGDPNDITGVGLGQITLAPVPELSMAWLFLGGLGALAALRRRQR